MEKSKRKRPLFALLIILAAAGIPLLFLSLLYSSAGARGAARYVTSTSWRPLFTESFEAGFDQDWQQVDTARGIKRDTYWISTTVTASHGIRSLTATSGGASRENPTSMADSYQKDATASMISRPIRIRGAKSLSLTFDAWLAGEPGPGYLEIRASRDGALFDLVQRLSGKDDAWQSFVINLNEYSSLDQIWVSISLVNTDPEFLDYGYIDNIILLGEFEDMPILLPVVRRDSDPTPTPVPEPGWLNHFNRYRLVSSLLPVTSVNDWSLGGELHSRYMVKNDYVGHYEDQNNPWYTPEGSIAAQNSNVFVTSWVDAPDETAIDYWMAAPFHAVSMLDPQLKATGLGTYREAIGSRRMAGTLDVRRGLGELPQGTFFPIIYPPAGGEAWLDRYPGGEFPNPLTSCPGFAAPSGPPIILQLGAGETIPNVSAYTFESDGQILESCLFDETSYVNSNTSQQNSGRNVLNVRDAVVMMPRSPLTAGKSYKVTIVTNDQTFAWSFSTSASLVSPVSFDSIQQQSK